MMHLIVDGKAYNTELLCKTEALSKWLIGITQLLGMKVIKGPICVETATFGPDAGITGVVIVSESHLAVHTWPERGDCTVNIDIFSCRPFDALKIFNQIKTDWDMDDCEAEEIDRPVNRPIGGS